MWNAKDDSLSDVSTVFVHIVKVIHSIVIDYIQIHLDSLK